MKKSKKNYVLIALVVILLCIAVGYAAFSANLTINGTANANGTWDVKFVKAAINEPGHGTVEPSISPDGQTLTVAVELSYPGDGCTVTANIKNSGTIPARLTAFDIYAEDGESVFTNPDITVTVPDDGNNFTSGENGEVIAAGETCPFTFSVQWNESSKATSATAKFVIKFTYSQPDAVTVSPDHGAHTK